LFGTTSSGGDPSCDGNGCGAVFKLVPPRAGRQVWAEIVLHTFSGADGAGPRQMIMSDDGTLYGTTQFGGGPCTIEGGCGVVFALAPLPGEPGWSQTVLYSFTGGGDGALPIGGMALGPDGVLFGTTTEGGALCDGDTSCGVVFALTPPTADTPIWTQTVLHRFTGRKDGAFPNHLILGEDAALYGTTTGGGDDTICNPDIGCGVVFKLVP
jgi:uncharacterized repeat protein (TIGR03803 family)